MKRIVYIHGFNSTGKIFNYLHSQLPEHHATMVEYDSSKPIEYSLEKILEETPINETISIVGHSLGGVLGHLLASRRIAGLNVEKFVGISAPYGGSKTASVVKWLYPSYKVLRDLSPGSKIIKEVTTAKTLCPFLSIVSTDGNLPVMMEDNDGIVTVGSQKAAKANRTIEIPSNHFEVVQDKATVFEIQKFLFN